MPRLIFHPEKIEDIEAFRGICPFNAIEQTGDGLFPGAACRLCRLCLKKGPAGAAELIEDEARPQLDRTRWQGICVFAEQLRGRLHPVTLELLGKARQLADIAHQKVLCLLLGAETRAAAEELRHYGADEIYVYDSEELRSFSPEPYTAVIDHFITERTPNVLLVGATSVGRQLAPRVAARRRTGLTADCTVLDISPEGELQQIRPAFGGNIMAQIYTPYTRPQMATVRYKVMDAPVRSEEPAGTVIVCSTRGIDLSSRVRVLEIIEKEQQKTIEAAEVLIVAGRGIKKQEDLELLRRLAEKLGGELACTRPLAEKGWLDARCQIGLSGRTVRPRLIMTFGVSGAVQFTAGMNHSEVIFAVNTDENAPIFKTAHYGAVADLYAVVPLLLDKL